MDDPQLPFYASTLPIGRVSSIAYAQVKEGQARYLSWPSNQKPKNELPQNWEDASELWESDLESTYGLIAEGNAAPFPKKGLAFLDSDTIVSQGSKQASYDAVNSVLTAIDNVQDGSYQNAFVSIRPPGHHAHSNFAAGFCIFNNIAIGACYLVKNYNLKRVLILDWDVHRGDGTAEIISNKKNIFLISSHQYPFYPPGDGTEKVRGHFDNIRFFPLKAGLSSNDFYKIYEKIFIEIDKYQPEFILISCGFDAHKNDPLAEINLESIDYEYLTFKVKKYAAKHCAGKIVSVLEGGYDLKSISESSKFHVKSLAKI